MSCARSSANTNDSKTPDGHSATGRRQAPNAPHAPSGPEPRRGSGARTGSRRRSSAPAEREASRQKLLDLVRQRPGITRAELNAAASLSGAGVAQNLRRMLDRGDVREEPLPGGTTGYRLADRETSEPQTARKSRHSNS
jgi:hypothetical protein